MSYRGPEGKTTGYYVPKELSEKAVKGVEAWRELQEVLREIAEENRRRLFGNSGSGGSGGGRGSTPLQTKKRVRDSSTGRR